MARAVRIPPEPSFDQQREPIVKFARETNVQLKQFIVEHPMPVFNTLNAYQWLIYIPLHTMRHDKGWAGAGC